MSEPPTAPPEPQHGDRSGSDATTTGPSGPPHTGNPLVDQALAEAAHLDPRDPSEQHDRLAAAHERLHLALDPDAVRDEPRA